MTHVISRQVSVSAQLVQAVSFPSPEHLDTLKCTAIRKLNEDYTELKIRPELPDGRSASRVGLPGLAPPPPPATAVAEHKTTSRLRQRRGWI